MTERTLAVIPARAGSKRLPGKNMLPLAGKPLLFHTIDEALRAKYLDTVLVSSDSEDILTHVTQHYGRRVVIDRRPAALATDTASTLAVMEDLARRMPEYTVFVVLQPTSPLRTAAVIDACVKPVLEGKYDSAETARAVTENPGAMLRIVGDHAAFYDEEQFFNKSKREQLYIENGAVYVMDRATLERGTLYGKRHTLVVMPFEDSWDIDEQLDFDIVRTIFERRSRGGSP